MFYLKDCSEQPRPPQRTIEGIARGVRIAFRLIPFVQSVELVGPEDIDGDCPIQLQVNIDPRFGMPFAPIFDEPWQPSRDVRFKPFSQYLLTELGRDVDCFAGDSARAREIGRDTKLVYEREPDYFLSDTIEPLFKSTENDAREAARCLEDDFRATSPTSATMPGRWRCRVSKSPTTPWAVWMYSRPTSPITWKMRRGHERYVVPTYG